MSYYYVIYNTHSLLQKLNRSLLNDENGFNPLNYEYYVNDGGVCVCVGGARASVRALIQYKS